jgi:hypothetical protein
MLKTEQRQPLYRRPHPELVARHGVLNLLLFTAHPRYNGSVEATGRRLKTTRHSSPANAHATSTPPGPAISFHDMQITIFVQILMDDPEKGDITSFLRERRRAFG